jgi:hypothetical protein
LLYGSARPEKCKIVFAIWIADCAKFYPIFAVQRTIEIVADYCYFSIQLLRGGGDEGILRLSFAQ